MPYSVTVVVKRPSAWGISHTSQSPANSAYQSQVWAVTGAPKGSASTTVEHSPRS